MIRILVSMLVAWLAMLSSGHAADPVRGQTLFMQHCASCHAPGQPVPGAPGFILQQRLLQPDSVLLEKIRDGVNAMPGYQGILDNPMILDVIAYMRTLQ